MGKNKNFHKKKAINILITFFHFKKKKKYIYIYIYICKELNRIKWCIESDAVVVHNIVAKVTTVEVNLTKIALNLILMIKQLQSSINKHIP